MRILIADDHVLVRDTIAAYLTNEGAFVVSATASLDEAITHIEKLEDLDIVLLDYSMPGMNGLEGLRKVKAMVGDTPVAILSGTATPAIAEGAIAAGASGFIPKTLPAKSIMSAATMMVQGEVFAPFNFMNQKADGALGGLTDRETEVLRGICEGKSNKEIALDLGLQEVTIKLHVKTLCRKLEAKNRTHAAMIAKTNNFV